MDYAAFLTNGCPVGAAAATMAVPEAAPLTATDLSATGLALDTGLPDTAATLPFVPELIDETAWSSDGTWDLEYATSQGRYLWIADAAPRGQSSTLELVQPVDLAKSPKAQISIEQRLALAGNDTLTLEVLPEGSAEWVVIDSQTALTTDWMSHTIDLSAFKKQTIHLRFRLTTGDESADGAKSLGIWLGSVSITR